MSNEISRVYQFLAQFNKNGRTWVDEADTSGDGYVIKSEFRAFMEDFEWDGETTQEAKNDLINTFWKSIDTNKKTSKIKGTNLRNNNALDNNEIAAMDYKIKGYETLNNYLASLKAPNIIRDSATWKQKINESLFNKVEEYIASNRPIEELAPYLEQLGLSVQNMTTADLCADQYLNSSEIKNLLKEYNYTYDKGTELYEIISNYVQNIPAESTPEEIQETVIQIVDAYLATADLKDDSGYPLEELGLNSNYLNDIQICVIKQKIKNDLSDQLSKYEGYEEAFNNALQEFIESQINSNKSFEELKNSASEFANSEFKIRLDQMVTIKETYGNIQKGSDFYNQLVSEFGETLADKIAENARYIDAYKEVVNDVTSKIQSGELSTEEVSDYMLKQIAKNIDKFLTNGLGDLDIEELNATYDRLVEAANAQKDDELSLQQHRDAAIKYCDALVKKGNEFLNLINEIFNTNDYKTTINNLLPSEIQNLMNDLKTKALNKITDIEGSKAINCTWNTSSLKNPNKIDAGTTASLNIGATIKLANGNTTAPDDYAATIINGAGNGAEVTVLKNGILTVKAPNVACSMEIQVYAIKDGQKIGEPITIHIKVEENASTVVNRVTDWGGAKSQHLESIGVNHGQQVTSSDFASLYNGDALIQLEFNEKSRGWDNQGTKNLVRTRLTELGNHIVSALTTAGLDKSKLSTATRTVINKYLNNHVPYKYSSGSGNQGRMREKINEKFKENADARHSLIEVYDTTGTDSHIFAVSFKDLVDDIIAEYNKL